MAHSYRNLASAADRVASAPKAAAAGHSYRTLSRAIAALTDQPRTRLRLVPQPLAPRQNPSDAPRFETDPVEAKRVAKILASLFALAAMGEPISQATRDKLGITTEDLTAIADKVGKARAAEIMGLKWDGEDLVPDPNADKAITRTTESQVNDAVDTAVATALAPGDTWAPGEGPNDTPAADTGLSDDEELALAIAALFAFSSLRPDVVADYETASMQNQLALTAYAAAGVTEVLVLDGEEFDEPCILANGQTWSIAQAMSSPSEHPGCVRSFLPLGADGMQLAARRMKLYAPDQARDDAGRFADEGKGGGGDAGSAVTGMKPSEAWPRALGETVRKFGFPMDKVDFYRQEAPASREFTVGGEKYQEGGHYDPATGKIILWGSSGEDEGIVTHEIMHAQWQDAQRAYQRERDLVAADDRRHLIEGTSTLGPNGEYGPSYARPGVSRADDSLWPEFKKDYPVYAAMQPILDSAGTFEALRQSDGVTDYSRSWWKEYETRVTSPNPEGAYQWRESAYHETLAEIAMLNHGEPLKPSRGGGAFHTSDGQMIAPSWGLLYNTVLKVRGITSKNYKPGPKP